MTDPQAALMVARIQQLYQVEHASVDLDPDARREQSVPLLAQIDVVRQDLTRTVLPKSPMPSGISRISARRCSALSRTAPRSAQT